MEKVTYRADSLPELAEKLCSDNDRTSYEYKLSKLFLTALDELTGQYPNIEDCPEDEIEALEDDYKMGLSSVGVYVNLE